MSTQIIQLDRDDLRTELRGVLSDFFSKYEKSTTALPQADVIEWGSRVDACKIAGGISMPTLHNLMNCGAVEYRKCGRKTLVNLTDLRAKIASGEIAKYKRNS